MEAKSRALAIAGGVAVSALGGAVFAWIGTPLPWMLGAIFATAAGTVQFTTGWRGRTISVAAAPTDTE